MEDNKKGFTVVQEWMLDYDLSASELLAYATIYGFSQNGQSKYEGTRKYLAKRSACSLSTIKRILLSLEEKGLIRKFDIEHPSGTLECQYQAVVQNEPGWVKMNQGVGQNEPPHIIDIYNTISTDKKKEEKNIYAVNKFFISSTQRAAVLNNPDEIAKIKRKMFIERITPIAKETGMDNALLQRFVDYWCECTDGTEKLRCEREDFFQVKSRMATFMRNNKDRRNSFQQPQVPPQPQTPHVWTEEELNNLYK